MPTLRMGLRCGVPAGLITLLAPALAGATPITEDDPHITRQNGVTIIHGHVDQPLPVTVDNVTVLEPVFAKDHDPYANWRAWAPRYRRAASAALPAPRPRSEPGSPPWAYTPSDQTYTPKTDWTYHPRVGPYTPAPTRWYTPKTDWTYHPTAFHSWW